MTIKEALEVTTTVIAYAGGLDYYVDGDAEDYSPTEPNGEPNHPHPYRLSIHPGSMPAIETKSYDSTEEIEAEYPGLDWQPVEEEEQI